MSLTTTEQVSILNGIEQPPSGYGLRPLVKQTAVEHAKTLLGSYKLFDAQAEPLASLYLQRLLNVVDAVTGSRESTFASLEAMLVSLYGETGTIATVQSATDAQWEGFLDTNIARAFELVSDVRQDEKTAYDALP